MREHLANDALSIGPYVLSGGELAAMVVADAVMRKLPGALGDEQSALEESFSRRSRAGSSIRTTPGPPSYRGWEVPEVLLSGDHEQVRDWRLEQARRRSAAPARLGRAARALRTRRAGGGVPLTSRAPPSRPRRPPARRRPSSPMNELIDSIERRQLRQVPALPGRRPGAGPLPGRGGHPAPHPGLRGRRAQASGRRRAADLHGAEALLRRRGRADVPAALAEDRAHRGRRPRRGAPGQALLPARPRRPARARAREPRLPARGRRHDGPRRPRRRPPGGRATEAPAEAGRRPRPEARPRQDGRARGRAARPQARAPRPRRPEAEEEPAEEAQRRGRGRAEAAPRRTAEAEQEPAEGDKRARPLDAARRGSCAAATATARCSS